MQTISFLVLALDEEEAIEGAFQAILDAIEASEGRVEGYEIILVDDGSSDRTGVIMDRLAEDDSNVSVVHNQTNLGVGGAFRRAAKLATMHHVMWVPGENSITTEGLTNILRHLGDADVILSYLTKPGVRGPLREFLSHRYTAIMNVISGRKLRYYNGCVVYPRELLLAVMPRSSSLAFQAEIVIALLRAGHSFVEVGMETRRRTGGKPKSLRRPKHVAQVVWTIARLYGSSRLNPRMRPKRE